VGRMMLVRLALVAALALVIVALPRWAPGWQPRVGRAVRGSLACLALGHALWMLAVFAGHLGFPLNLDPMEGTLVEHLRRLAQGRHVYEAPGADFVALAYNPLYYVVAVPVAKVAGVGVGALRFVSVASTVGAAWVLYRAVGARTGSAWWSLAAVGLFAAAYRVMDAYLDTAHADASLLFAVLAGCHLLDRRRDRAGTALGLTLLVAGFWFKQHGALFAAGGLLYVLARDGVRRALPYALLVAALGPALYVFAGLRLFGSHFHYYTWEVPRRWGHFDGATALRYAAFIARNYAALAPVALWEAWRVLRGPRASWTVWHVQLGAALTSGLLGELDEGSSDNVFIPMGTWFIALGAMGLHALSKAATRSSGAHHLALAAAYAAFLYNPADVWTSPDAHRSYADLRALVRGLPGTVYMPWQGALPEGDLLWPTAHQIAVEDLVRGPGRDASDAPLVRRILLPVLRPRGSAWVLAHRALERTPKMRFLLDCYVREADFGDRFKPLTGLPRAFVNGWPRYLYRYAPNETGRCREGESQGPASSRPHHAARLGGRPRSPMAP
jgi:hypothetical protein